MPQLWHLGNDVVDRADTRYRDKARDDRFLRRVFAEEEEGAIRDARDPDLALWLRWTAKEAAFKSVTKFLGSPPVFHHRDFRVLGLEERSRAEKAETHTREAAVEGLGKPEARAGGNVVGSGRDDPSGSVFSGQLVYGDLSLALGIRVTPEAIHALAWAESTRETAPVDGSGPHAPLRAGVADLPPPPAEPWRDALEAHLTAREWECVSHLGSALTRVAAKEALAEALEIEEEALEIVCGPGLPGRRVPSVLLGGEELSVDLTLSHHGRFQAWAFRIP